MKKTLLVIAAGILLLSCKSAQKNIQTVEVKYSSNPVLD